MKLGIVSDIHGDLEGLQAALSQLDRHGVDKIVCAGDVVGMAPSSDEVVSLIRERGIPTVRGNWDAWAVGRGRPDEPHAPASGAAWDALGRGLSKGSLRWLAHLPVDWRQTVDGVSVCMFHGSPDDAMRGVLADTPEAGVRRLLLGIAPDVRVVLLGHTHRPMRRLVDGRILCNPGAVLRPALDPAVPNRATGTCGVLSLPAGEFAAYAVPGGAPVAA